jgi:hypothetical protein
VMDTSNAHQHGLPHLDCLAQAVDADNDHDRKKVEVRMVSQPWQAVHEAAKVKIGRAKSVPR